MKILVCLVQVVFKRGWDGAQSLKSFKWKNGNTLLKDNQKALKQF